MSRFSNICRFCLCEKSTIEFHFDELSNIVKQITYVLPQIAIMESERVQMCSSCQTRFNSFYTFKKLCLDNNKLSKDWSKLQELNNSGQTSNESQNDNEQFIKENPEMNVDIEMKEETKSSSAAQNNPEVSGGDNIDVSDIEINSEPEEPPLKIQKMSPEEEDDHLLSLEEEDDHLLSSEEDDHLLSSEEDDILSSEEDDNSLFSEEDDDHLLSSEEDIQVNNEEFSEEEPQLGIHEKSPQEDDLLSSEEEGNHSLSSEEDDHLQSSEEDIQVNNEEFSVEEPQLGIQEKSPEEDDHLLYLEEIDDQQNIVEGKVDVEKEKQI